MLSKTLWNETLPKGIVGTMLWEMGMRAQSLQKTQSEAWGNFDSGRLDEEINELIKDRDYLLSLLSS